MAIDHRAAATTAFASGITTIGIVVPASVQDDDIAYVVLYSEKNSPYPSWTVPSGQGYVAITGTNPATNTTTNPDFLVHRFWTRLQAADAGTTHTFTSSVTIDGAGGMEVMSGALTSGAPEDATETHTVNAAASTSLVAPDITPATQPHLELAAAASFAGPTIWTIPAGMTAYGYTSDTTGLAYLRRTTTVAPGTRTHVVNTSGRWTAWHALYKEQAAAGATVRRRLLTTGVGT